MIPGLRVDGPPRVRRFPSGARAGLQASAVSGFGHEKGGRISPAPGGQGIAATFAC